MTAPSAVYAAHMAAARGLYEAQMRLIDAKRRVAVLNADLSRAKAEQQKMVVDLDRKRRAARGAEEAFYEGVEKARDEAMMVAESEPMIITDRSPDASDADADDADDATPHIETLTVF
jgi:hypothetical protein